MPDIVAFIDLVGFGSMVTQDHNRAKEILTDFYNITYNIFKDEGDIKGSLISDSLIAYSNQEEKLVNALTRLYRDCFKKNDEYANSDNFFLLPRGGVSFGIFKVQELNELPNLTKEFIISPALVHSARIEASIKGSRLLLGARSNGGEDSVTWNTKIKSILYQDNSISLWGDYKYMDALWFLDLNKDRVHQEEEILELLNLAINFVQQNDSRDKHLNQYINTLRIGLLSYSKFINIRSEDPIISRLIDDFQDSKYWFIWLTIIEMIMESPDSWALPNQDYIIKFYKSVSIKKGWSHVIEEVNKPEMDYLKQDFNSFLDEMLPISG
ncbi:MAG: hypothetical protein IIA45_04675 [Bacteroidetes bacterium]|nr:hypothetical protein [Bacteroidota bacterium]